MNKKELADLAPELLEALEKLYAAYEAWMIAEYNTWSPEEAGDPSVMEAKKLIEKARST